MKTVQFLLFIGFCLTHVLGTTPTPEQMKEAKESCVESLKIKTTKRGAVDQQDSNFKCFHYCFGKKIGIIDAKANPVISMIPKETNSTKEVEACAASNKETENCAKATWLRNCIKNKMTIKLEKKLSKISDQCSKETNTPVSDYPTMKQNALLNIYNKTLECYHRCIFIKTHVMDEDNKYKVTHIDKMTKEFGITGMDKGIKSCMESNKQTDKCEQAVKRNICVGKLGALKYAFSKNKSDAELLY